MISLTFVKKVIIIKIVSRELTLTEIKSALDLANKPKYNKIVVDLKQIKKWPISQHIINFLDKKRYSFIRNDGEIIIILPTGLNFQQKKNIYASQLAILKTVREALIFFNLSSKDIENYLNS